MRVVAGVFAVVAAVLAYATLGGAETFAIGEISLKAPVLDIGEKIVSGSGGAVLTTENGSVRAASILIGLAEDKSGTLAMQEATAKGGVTIHVRQGKDRIVDANSAAATMRQGEDAVVLTGNVSVKVSDPKFARPAVITGERVTVYLKEKRITAEKGSDGQSEIRVTPKPKEKKEPEKK